MKGVLSVVENAMLCTQCYGRPSLGALRRCIEWQNRGRREGSTGHVAALDNCELFVRDFRYGRCRLGS